jgi:signal recognition particle receptor subunit beta
MDELGAEGEDNTELGGLDCVGRPGEAFKFADWEGGDIEFLSSYVKVGERVELGEEKGRGEDGIERLLTWLGQLQ